MFKLFLRVTYKNFFRNGIFSFINIAGLSIGMAIAILILLWVQNEMSHDRFHQKGDRIYMMYNQEEFSGQLTAWNNTPKMLGPTIKKDYPEVEDVARVARYSVLCTVGDKKLHTDGIYTDTGFLKIFSFPLLEGNASTALNDLNGIVITEKLAKALFGNADPMGKTIKLGLKDILTVTGVLKNLPNNTSFDFDFLLPWSYLVKMKGEDNNWENHTVRTYVLLRPGVSNAAFDKKIKNIITTHSGNKNVIVFSWPLNKEWLYSKNENGKLVGGRIETVRLFAVISMFVLLIACINFMNLSTARSEKRAKEVGIRKVVGAQKETLILQFIGESVLFSLLAGIIALLLVHFSLNSFNSLVGKQLELNISDPYFWILWLGFTLLTGVLAGSYPAFFLSTLKPVKVLKGTFRAAHAIVNPRKILVVLQFTIAITLIITTIVLERQIKYVESRDVGYKRDNLVFTSLEGDIGNNYELIRQGLLNSGAAVAVTKSMSPITRNYSDGWGLSWEGMSPGDEKLDFLRMSADADFVKALGATLIEGRDIDIRKYPADSSSILLNETAIKKMRLKKPLGAVVRDRRDWTVVGVVRDFIVESPYDPVPPMIIMGPHSWFTVMHYKLNPDKTVSEDLALAREVFKKYNPEYPFEYNFIDEEYATKFESARRSGSLAALSAGLAIFISCLGLFGLTAYMVENRVKEIGIRKVLGGSVLQLWRLLSKDFIVLVFISFAIASPLAFYYLNNDLQSYSYRIRIGPQVFIITLVVTIIITLITVSFQTIKAAMANPVKSLRTE